MHGMRAVSFPIGSEGSSALTPNVGALRFRKADFDKIPRDAFGVYGIWFRRRCIYIGEAYAQPITVRLAQHWKQSHNSELADWVKAKGSQLRVTYVVVSGAHNIHELERSSIRRFQPVTNRVGKAH